MDLHDFENLTPEEQARAFHLAPFKERGELLLHSHNPGALTRSLSEEELYLVTRHLDIEEKAEVIKYASLPQLFFIADLDCWKKDRLNVPGFLTWIETLLQAGELKLLQWLVEMDYETVTSGFKQIIMVLKPDTEWAVDDVLGDTPYFTIDNFYYVAVTEENLGTVRRALEILFEKNRGRYVALMEGILAEVEDTLEEEAYQRREIRLTERGFPDFETARQIYRPMTREEFDAFPKKYETPEAEREMPVLPNYPVLWSQDRVFLDDVLQLLREDPHGIYDHVREELAWLSNKVIAGEGIDFSTEEYVKRGIERARSMINIGLEDLSGGDLAEGRKILETRWLEVLFRWGVTQVMTLRDTAFHMARMYWKTSKENCLEFLDQPYDQILTGFFKALPLYYDEKHPDDSGLRDFRSLAEVERGRKSAHQVDFLHQVIAARFKNLFSNAVTIEARYENNMTLFSITGTAFAHWVQGRSLSVDPLPVKEAVKFLDKAFEPHGTKRRLKADLRRAFPAVFAPEDKHGELLTFWALFFDRLEDEFGRLARPEELDPRYVDTVHFKRSADTDKVSPKQSSRTKRKGKHSDKTLKVTPKRKRR